MNKKALFLLFGFLFVFVMGFATVQASEGNVEVTITSIFDDENTIVATPEVATYGSKLTLGASSYALEGYEFAFWIVNGVVRKDLPIEHSFTVTSKLDLEVVFHPEGKFVVLFMDVNGKVLDTQFVLSGQDASDPSITLPSKIGYEVANPKWDGDLTNIQENTVFVLQYAKTSTDSFALTVNGGSGSDVGYEFNEIVTVAANAPTEGEFFSHWEDEDGKVLSYLASYSFTMVRDLEVTAVYSEVVVEKVPHIIMSNDLALRVGRHTYLNQFFVPEGYELIEFGMVSSDTNPNPEIFDENVTLYQGTVHTATTYEFVMSITENSFSYIKSYMVLKDNLNQLAYYYSDVVYSTYVDEQLLFAEDFATYPNIAYAETSATFGGLDWTVREVWLNPDASDKNNTLPEQNEKMIRMRGANTAYIEMDDYLPYISRLTFLAKYYSSTSPHPNALMKVWTQVTGEEWVEIATIPLLDAYQRYNVLIDESNVRLKVTVNVGSVNMDMINVYGEEVDQKAFVEMNFTTSKFVIPSETTENVTLPSSIFFLGYQYNLEWTSSDSRYINSNGDVNRPLVQEGDQLVTLLVKLSLDFETELVISYEILIIAETEGPVLELIHEFNFGTTQRTGYASGTWNLVDIITGNTFEILKDGAQITTNNIAPHPGAGNAFMVMQGKSATGTPGEAFAIFNLQASNISYVEFDVAMWSNADFGSINQLETAEFQVKIEGQWLTLLDFKSHIKATEYTKVEVTVETGSEFRIFIVQAGTGNVRIAIDNLKFYSN